MLRQDNVGAKRGGSFGPCYPLGLRNHLWASSCTNFRNGICNAAAQYGQKEISQYGILELPSGMYSEKLNWAPVGPPGDSACGGRGGINQAKDWKETVAVSQRSVARETELPAYSTRCWQSQERRNQNPTDTDETVLHNSREHSTQEPGVLPWRPREAKYMALKTLALYFSKRTPKP